MTPEQKRRFIEEEKAHLRKMRGLKVSARARAMQAAAKNRINAMVTGFTSMVDTHTEFVDRLQDETAVSEARLDMALEQKRESLEDARAARLRRADALVAQLEAAELASKEGSSAYDDLPESSEHETEVCPKTIGRMPGAGASDDAGP